MPIEQVTNSATGNTEECTSCQSIEKPTHKHRLDVLGHRAWNEPDEEQGERDDVDVPSAVELDKVSTSPLSRMTCTHLREWTEEKRSNAYNTSVVNPSNRNVDD